MLLESTDGEFAPRQVRPSTDKTSAQLYSFSAHKRKIASILRAISTGYNERRYFCC